MIVWNIIVMVYGAKYVVRKFYDIVTPKVRFLYINKFNFWGHPPSVQLKPKQYQKRNV